MKNLARFLAIIFYLISYLSMAQSKTDKILTYLGERVFSPSLEIGYINHGSSNINGSLMFKSSTEYRFQNNSDFFLRLNYDSYNSKYEIHSPQQLGNILKGSVNFSDLILGPGYRHGSQKNRFFVLTQSGIKFFSYPQALQNSNIIEINLERKRTFTGRITTGYEYYINDKSALTIEGFFGHTFNERYFWQDSRSAYGISLGFVTSIL